jgi:DNA-binding Lrp family transcriptional regulator
MDVTLDRIDRELLNHLQADCRMPFTQLAERLGISNYEAKKRYERLIEHNVFYPRVQLRLRHLGFKQMFHVRVSLVPMDASSREAIIAFLKDLAYVGELFSVSGNADLMFVVAARDGPDYDIKKAYILDSFSESFRSWEEFLTPRTYKFETYDVHKLLTNL